MVLSDIRHLVVLSACDLFQLFSYLCYQYMPDNWSLLFKSPSYPWRKGSTRKESEVDPIDGLIKLEANGPLCVPRLWDGQKSLFPTDVFGNRLSPPLRACLRSIRPQWPHNLRVAWLIRLINNWLLFGLLFLCEAKQKAPSSLWSPNYGKVIKVSQENNINLGIINSFYYEHVFELG